MKRPVCCPKKIVKQLTTLNRLELCRHIEALQCNAEGGVYEWGTI